MLHSQNICNLDLQFIHIDIFNSLGHDVNLQQTVVRNIESFLDKLINETIAHMIKYLKHKHWTDMWCISSIDSTSRMQLYEINMIFFLVSYIINFI